MPVRWIDFRALKAQVPIQEVLARYGFVEKLRKKGREQLVGPCPIHGGENKNSFHVNTEKSVFNCFSQCGGGNVLDFVAKVEGCSVREAGEKLASWFDLTFDKGAGPRAGERPTSEKPVTAARQDEPAVNSPLKRPLVLDPDHPYLVERGLTVPTVKTFGLGYCKRGLMRGRIAIPIHDERGELVAYAGRAISEELAREKGKYRLPDSFKKSHVLYNLNRAGEHAGSGLIVVEGFFGAMKVHQAGFPNVVALMGSTVSEEQEQLLLGATERLALMLDGDDAGVKCLRQFYGRLRRRIFLKEVQLEEGEQPDDLAEERIRDLLG